MTETDKNKGENQETHTNTENSWLDEINWTDNRLIPVITQDKHTQKVLMFAWMNPEALQETVKTGKAVYYSRSRGRLWRKGEESGYSQSVSEIRLDCDADVLLLTVNQSGGIACHTGRQSCFFRIFTDGHWQTVEPVLKDPKEIYRHE